ncbi:signal peptidase II [Streptomyces sp. NBC_01166]|uniref:signal peptidase II n=1 Tax=Streptomyces sp. NBC_01166 TaxID=2903755 RepID=UPI00386F5A61
MLTLAAVVLLADQLAKFWAVSALSTGESVTAIPTLIHFRLLCNAGAAFSIGSGATWVFALATAGAVVSVLYAAPPEGLSRVGACAGHPTRRHRCAIWVPGGARGEAGVTAAISTKPAIVPARRAHTPTSKVPAPS